MISLSVRQFVIPAVCLLAGVAQGKVVDERTLRALEENGYQYLDDLSGYQMQFGKCVRVKVPEDGDDEGNSYFYNGHYYAQAQQFASVYLCQASSGSSSTTMCGVCDTEKEYVTDLATYLETTLEYAALMCQSCTAQCGGRRRRLEEAASMTVDCSTCTSTCANMNFGYMQDNNENNNNANANVNDETMYLDCQAAYVDADGIQLYAGPQCNADADIVIGFYYDDECTVKSSSADMDYGFKYGTFRGIQSMCLNCNAYGNEEDEFCESLYMDATHCSKGRNLAGGDDEDEMPICKTLEKTYKEKFYGSGRRNTKVLKICIAVIVVATALFGFAAASYTYYLRHRANKDKREPLTEHDHHTEPEVTITGSRGDLTPGSY
jgi:hypothetical protein